MSVLTIYLVLDSANRATQEFSVRPQNLVVMRDVFFSRKKNRCKRSFDISGEPCYTGTILLTDLNARCRQG
jgi:hypothetical protein